MHFFNFVSIKLTLGLVIGIVLGFYLKIDIHFLLVVLVILLPFLFLIGKRQLRNGVPIFELVTSIFTIILGMLVVGMSTPNSLEKIHQEDMGLWELKIREVLKPNSYTESYVAKIRALNSVEESGNLILRIPADSSNPVLQVDDELLVHGKLEELRPPLNPHAFDYRDYLVKQGVPYQIRTQKEKMFVRENPTATLYGVASRFREDIISKLKKEAFGPEELGVIQALVLGYRYDISEEIYTSYKNAGAVHILAVSGLHVGILMFLLQFLLSPLKRLPNGTTLTWVGLVLLLWAYAFVAGLSPSIVRAVTMFSFVAYAMNLNRPTNPFNILSLSMFFILLFKPLFLFQVGFQMSYAAVFAIVWIYPKLERFWSPSNFILRKGWQLLSVSISAQLGVLPLSLYYFHQFPALFFVSNLLILPFLGLLLGLGLAIVVLSLTDLLPNFLVVGYDYCIKLMNSIVAWVGQQEAFLFKNISFDVVQMILGYAFIIFSVELLSKLKRKKLIGLGVSLLLFQFWVLRNEIQVRQKDTLILAHKTGKTIVLHQHGRNLKVYARDSATTEPMVQNYAIAERIDSISKHPIQNSYQFDHKQLYIMDSLAIYPQTQPVDYLLLTQSPKIHLERLLDSVPPKMVLADGSNYTSFLNQWKETCNKRNIPFHATREKGYYSFDGLGN